MKKVTTLLLAIVAVAALAIGMVGCSGGTAAPQPSPTNSTKAAIDAVKALDGETLAKYYAGEIPEDFGNMDALYSSEEFASMTDDEKAMLESIVKKVLDFDYAVENEQVDGDKATVDVTITTYDFGGAIQSMMAEVMTQYMQVASGGDTEAATAAMIETVQKGLDGLTAKDVSNTVTLGVTKDAEGNWKVDDIATLSEEDQDKLADAVLGGLLTKMESAMGAMSNILGEALADADFSSLLDDTSADKAA